MATANGDLDYAHEKLGTSVDVLATSHGSLQERLWDAWISQGHRAVPMGPGQAGRPMSDELVRKLEAFNERMSSKDAVGNEGAYAASILTMTDEEASEAARELLSMHHQVEWELENQPGR